MVNWQAVGSGIIIIAIALFFFFSSFLFVNDNGSFQTGGLGLFFGGIAGIVFGIICVIVGFTKR